MPNATRRPIRFAVANQTDVSMTDGQYADLAALITGESLVNRAFFTVDGSADTTDDALQAAKGSAPAAGDRFFLYEDGSIAYL